MADPAQRDQVARPLVTQTGVTAVVKMSSLEQPRDTADETTGFDAVASRPVLRPLFPYRKPLRAGHVVAISGPPTETANRPDEAGTGITHRPTN